MQRGTASAQRKQARAVSAALVVVVASLTSACYHYVPVPEAGPSDGERVRVALTSAGAAELARYIGPRVTTIEGQVIRASADSGLLLGVEELRMSDGTRTPWQGDAALLVPAMALASVEQRQLSRRRTMLASAAAVTGVIVIGVVAVQRGGKQSPDLPPPPPPPP